MGTTVVSLTDSYVPSLPKGWNATVRIKESDGTTLATVYVDANGDAVGANPLPRGEDFGVQGDGEWLCYVVPGDYVVSVTPHGGSEQHASVTVAAPTSSERRAVYEVYGTPAAGQVPTWSADDGRLEWADPTGGGAAGSLPVGDDEGATVDTTTYDNTVTGEGKLTTMVFPTANNDGNTAALAIAVEGDAFPRWLLLSDASDGLYFGDGTLDPYADGGYLEARQDGGAMLHGSHDGGTTVAGGGNSVQMNTNGITLNINVGNVKMFLPTEDPGVEGALWSDGGVVTVSGG